MILKEMRANLLKNDLSKDYTMNIKIRRGVGFSSLSFYKVWQMLFDMICKEQSFWITENKVIIKDEVEPSETLKGIYEAFINNREIRLKNIGDTNKPRYRIL